MLDLRMMHHYSVNTADYFAADFPPAVASILKVDLPRLAYGHEVLMDAILLVSRIHFECTEPELRQSLPVYVYRDQALRSLRESIGNISNSNIAAVRGASVLLATVSFATDRVSHQNNLWVVNWLTLAHGRRNIRTHHPDPGTPPTTSHLDGQSAVSGLYGSFADLLTDVTITIGMLRAIEKDDSTYSPTRSHTLRKAATEISGLYSALASPYEQLWFVKQIKAWAFDMVDAEFLDLVRAERPCAIVILAYYLALLALLPDTWVHEGVLSHDMPIIVDKLGPEWTEFIVTPKMVSETKSREAWTELLLSVVR